jgi:hypothetical protein
MNMLKRVLPETLAWMGLVFLCGAIALAQDPASVPASAPDSTRTDGQIEMDVVHALDASKDLVHDMITAATIQSEVTLSGSVSSKAARDLAETIVSHVPGVTKVNNNLTIGNAQPAAQADSQQGDIPPPPNPEDEPTAPAMNVVPGQSGGSPALRDQIRAEVQAQIQAQRETQQAPKGPVTVPAETLLLVRTSEPVGTKFAKDGQPVQFVVIQGIRIGGVLAIPRGAVVHGEVTEVKKSGDFKGSPELALRLTSLDLGGQSYPLETNQFKVKGPGKGGRTANNVVGGAMMGTIIGCIAGRGVGCAVGAGAGAAAGTAASAATPGPNVWIPAEARLDFHLKAPLTVTPVSAQEAAKLSEGLFPGGPNLYRRGYDPYGRPYPYAYPQVYYRPYYAEGGFYYWR